MQSKGHLENLKFKFIPYYTTARWRNRSLSGIYTAKCQDVLDNEKLRQQKKKLNSNSAVFQMATV